MEENQPSLDGVDIIKPLYKTKNSIIYLISFISSNGSPPIKSIVNPKVFLVLTYLFLSANS